MGAFMCECVSGGLTGLNGVEEVCAIFAAGWPGHPTVCFGVCV